MLTGFLPLLLGVAVGMIPEADPRVCVMRSFAFCKRPRHGISSHRARVLLPVLASVSYSSRDVVSLCEEFHFRVFLVGRTRLKFLFGKKIIRLRFSLVEQIFVALRRFSCGTAFRFSCRLW